MATRAQPPFRADHVGSLLRPAAVLEARLAKTMERITDGELRTVEDQAVSELVRRQEEIGLLVATDGEIRRSSWHMDFISSLDGVSEVEGQITVAFRNAAGAIEFSPPAYAIDGPLGVSRTIFGEDFDFLAGSVRTATAKQTIPSPSMVHFRGGRAALTYPRYLDVDAFWADLAAAYRREIEGLYERGCRYLQLDDTSLAYLNDPAQREAIAARGGSALHQHEEYINHINDVLRDRPEDLTVTIHLCRGNYRSSWAAEGSYEFVAEELFGRLEVDGFFLEFDDERSGGFAPLRFVPEDKLVVLGLVTTKGPELESPDTLGRRIDEAARVVPLERLCLSPQCGFASTAEGNALREEDQFAKLRLVVEVAAKVWGS